MCCRKISLDRASLAINFISITIVAAALVVFSKQLYSPDLWLDESGQFLLSIGQYHFSEFGKQFGTLYDSWSYSKKYNLDPGGYTVLLRLWIEAFGTSPFVLRLLSLTFAITPILLIFSVSRIMRLPFSIAIIAAIIPLANPGYLGYALEIRAYSMEFCGVIAIYWATVLLLKSITWRYIVLWVFVNVFFVSSRYSATIYTASACLILILSALNSRNNLFKIVVALAAVAAFVFIEYFYMLRYQAANATPPEYVQQFLLQGKDFWGATKILKENLLGYGRTFVGRQTLLISIFILSLPIFIKIKRSGGFSEISQAALVAYVYVVASFIMWILLSITGKMPWSISQRWSMSYLMLAPISFLAICSLLSNFYLQSNRLKFNISFGFGSAIISGFALIFSLCVANNIASYKRGCFECLYAPLPVLKENFATPPNVVFSMGLYPDFKYSKEFSGIPLDKFYSNSYFVDLADNKSTLELINTLSGPTAIVSAEWGNAQRTALQKSIDGSQLIENLDENNVMYVLKFNP